MDSRAFDMLKQQSLLGAVFNSAERTHVPRCHPNTRVAVFEDIMHWLHDNSHQRPLLIITGTTGTGKTTVMQTLAERLYPHGQLVATYFVTPTLNDNSTVDHKQRTAKSGSSGCSKLVTTLAFQIASWYPTIRPFILGAVEGNPAIFSASLASQLEELIRRPVVASRTAAFQGSNCCIVVDGLDECGSDENQAEVIRLFHNLGSDPEMPFRVVLSSRPEFPIRLALGGAVSSLAYHLELDRSYNAEEDIERYVREELCRIRADLLPHVSASSWPSPIDVSTIRVNSSGQFIFAATALKYVDNRYYDPRTRLKEVIEWCSPEEERPDADSPRNYHENSPFRPLDELYTNIVLTAAAKAFPGQDTRSRAHDLLLLLGQLYLLYGFEPTISSLRTTEDFLFLEHGRILRLLGDLRSVVMVQDYGGHVYTIEDINLHHQSFGDFICDPRRSGDLHVTYTAIATSISTICTRHLISATPKDLHQALILNNADNPALTFALMYWTPFLQDTDFSPEVVTLICSMKLRVWENLIDQLDAWELFTLQSVVCVDKLRYILEQLDPNSAIANFLSNLTDIIMKARRRPVCKDPDLIRRQAEWVESESWDEIDDEYSRTNLAPSIENQGQILSSRWIKLERDLLETDIDIERVQIGFILGSPYSGKTSLLKFALTHLRTDVDPYVIVVRPSFDGRGLTLSNLQQVVHPTTQEPCGSRVKEFARVVDLEEALSSHRGAVIEFLTQLWKAAFPSLRYGPLILLEDFHLMSPTYQTSFLDQLMLELGRIQESGRGMLRVVVASRPVASIADLLEQQPGPGVYYINLDVSYRAFSLIEDWLWLRLVQGNPLPEAVFPRPGAEEIYKVAQLLTRSRKMWYYSTKIVHFVILRDPSLWKQLLTMEAPSLFDTLETIPFVMTEEYSDFISRAYLARPGMVRQLR
ncbi:hypothetical protein MD484_g4879, partial [Candolleomyces efflorescens]